MWYWRWTGAGLVGEDGETHQGVFDVAYLDSVPGITVYAPASFAELDRMLEEAVCRVSGPVAVRYPRGGQGEFRGDSGPEPVVVLRAGTDITLAGYGTELNELLGAADRLAQEGIQAEVVKWNIITPLETSVVLESVRRTGHLLVAEECVEQGSGGRADAAALEAAGVQAPDRPGQLRTGLCDPRGGGSAEKKLGAWTGQPVPPGHGGAGREQ